MLLWIHPVIGVITVLSIGAVAFTGWRSKFMKIPGSAARHARWGTWLIGLLAVTWTIGLEGVALAHRDGAPPAMSGHFITACILLAGYTASAVLMFKYGHNVWVRRLHIAANSLLLLLVASQFLLGVNRLYKFDLLPDVPQSQFARSILQIKFGLHSPTESAEPGHTYTWDTPDQGMIYGGSWSGSDGVISQTDCACSGNPVVNYLTLDGRFPLLAFSEPVFADFAMSAEFRIISGSIDQYAALAFRIVDQNNYYAVRASASEQSVSLARFNNGTRQVLRVFPAKIVLGHWQSLQLAVVDDEIAITLDGLAVGTVTDDGWKTGLLGLGTKADSVAAFRNVTATEQ